MAVNHRDLTKLRIVVADDHGCLREAVAYCLALEPDMEVVGEAADGEQALKQVRLLHPDVLLLDLSLPRVSGLQVLRTLALEPQQTTLTIVLSMHPATSYAETCFDAGAAGYLPKETSARELVRTIRAVAKGARRAIRATVPTPHLVAPSSPNTRSAFDRLSARELEVLGKIADGYTSVEIARQLGVTKATVETYRARMAQKLGLRRRSELVRAARGAGLLTP